MKNSRITVIGCGNMGQSLIGGLIASGFPEKHISATDSNATQREVTASRYNITVLQDNRRAVENADVVILAVKPQSIEDTLQFLKASLSERRPLIISIAAGIKLSHLVEWAGQEIAVVRAMPNMPVLVQAGATALFANESTSSKQRELAEIVMGSVGLALWLDDEILMDAVTALSGSGPAYYFLVMEVMEKAAIRLGLPQEQARRLTLQTAFGATKMALQSSHEAESLRKQVTSAGGTTEQALKVLMDGGLEALFADAMKAAEKRAAELVTLMEKE